MEGSLEGSHGDRVRLEDGRGHRGGLHHYPGLNSPEEAKPRFWTRAKLVGAAAVGLATIAGTVIAALQLPIW
mgnify:CR=1 FL=1